MAMMVEESYRCTLPSERHRKVTRIGADGARSPAVGQLVAVPPDQFKADRDDWLCDHPNGGGADPGWVARVGREFEKHPDAAKGLIELLVSKAPSDTTGVLEGALELALAAIQGSRDAAEQLASAAYNQDLGGGTDVLVHMRGAYAGGNSPAVTFNALTFSAYLLRRAPAAYSKKHLENILNHISETLKSTASWTRESGNKARAMANAEAAVKALSLLCEPPENREVIVKKGLAASLVHLLTATGDQTTCALASDIATNIQFVYEGTQCLWLLTFSPEVLQSLYSSCGKQSPVIRMLNSLVRKQKRDKCVRMALLTLKNFTKHHQDYPPGTADTNYVKEMISVGMLNTLQILKKRAFGDEDIVHDINDLDELLETNAEDLSSYVQYKQEINSGELEWSPPHTSEKFWRENIRMFENDGWAPMIELANIILRSYKKDIKDAGVSRTICIACNDLGEFVRHHPQGRKVWDLKLAEKSIDGQEGTLKTAIMELISGEREAEGKGQPISRQALLCMQKVLVRKWDHLDKA